MTNFREENAESQPGQPSRGQLPVDVVIDTRTVQDFIKSRDLLRTYAGCNMVAADLAAHPLCAVYASNRAGDDELNPMTLGKGLHVISNGQIT